MNRTLTNVLFGGIGSPAAQSDYKIEGAITKTSVDETVDALNNAENVILVGCSFSFSCGLGLSPRSRSWAMAWRSPKHSLPSRTSCLCCARKVSTCVSLSTRWPAGAFRPSEELSASALTTSNLSMPGQCNVLLAEASVPYDSESPNPPCRGIITERERYPRSRPGDGRDQR